MATCDSHMSPTFCRHVSATRHVMSFRGSWRWRHDTTSTFPAKLLVHYILLLLAYKYNLAACCVLYYLLISNIHCGINPLIVTSKIKECEEIVRLWILWRVILILNLTQINFNKGIVKSTLISQVLLYLL